jgi:hypothetical protein
MRVHLVLTILTSVQLCAQFPSRAASQPCPSVLFRACDDRIFACEYKLFVLSPQVLYKQATTTLVFDTFFDVREQESDRGLTAGSFVGYTE